MNIARWRVTFLGWHNWRWVLRSRPFERDAMWLTLLDYRGRGFRFLFWHACELKACTCAREPVS